MLKLPVQWVLPDNGLEGNALGYNTHRKFLMKHAEPYLISDQESEIAIHVAPGDCYVPIKGKKNVLFTMWEASELPSKYVIALNRCDLIIVPCRFCRDVFKKYTNVPIEVCGEGVESDLFPYYERIEPLIGTPFRFLWVGASNPRKGYVSMMEAAKMIEQTPDCELYLKTTFQKFDRKEYLSDLWKKRQWIRLNIRDGNLNEDQSVKNMLKRAKVRRTMKDDGEIKTLGKYKNIIFDNRKVPFEELVKLYNSAHCFVLPTMGEGWGLTLCEAMATGCPSIATPVTGCADFFDETVGYPIKYTHLESYFPNYDVRASVCIPDTVDLITQMIKVYHNYREALAKGKKASERIHKKFTWQLSGQRLRDIMNRYFYPYLKEEALQKEGVIQ